MPRPTPECRSSARYARPVSFPLSQSDLRALGVRWAQLSIPRSAAPHRTRVRNGTGQVANNNNKNPNHNLTKFPSVTRNGVRISPVWKEPRKDPNTSRLHVKFCHKGWNANPRCDIQQGWRCAQFFSSQCDGLSCRHSACCMFTKTSAIASFSFSWAGSCTDHFSVPPGGC